MNYKENKNNTQSNTTTNTTADDTVFKPVPLTLVTESLQPQPKNIAIRKSNDK